MSVLEELVAQAAACKRRTGRGMMELVLVHLTCLGTHTVAGLLQTCGHPFRDWSAEYRFYEGDRVDPERLFGPIRRRLYEHQQGPFVPPMDDTRLRKTGRKVHGVKYVRDPMGRRFGSTSSARNGLCRPLWPARDPTAKPV